MRQRAIVSNVVGMSREVCALVAMLSLVGCNSEPAGDAAFSQKFEKPAGVGAGPEFKNPSSRAKEREEDREDALKRKSKRPRKK